MPNPKIMRGHGLKYYGWDFLITMSELALPYIGISFPLPLHTVNAPKHWNMPGKLRLSPILSKHSTVGHLK
jgi:hypothetical protein